MTSNNILENVPYLPFFEEVLIHIERNTCNYFREAPIPAIGRSTSCSFAIRMSRCEFGVQTQSSVTRRSRGKQRVSIEPHL
jgi:hypothetical protein